jgi:hypothetical protein
MVGRVKLLVAGSYKSTLLDMNWILQCCLQGDQHFGQLSSDVRWEGAQIVHRRVEASGAKLLVVGLHSSTLLSDVVVSLPAMSTSPLGSSAAMATSRAVFIVGSEAAGAKLFGGGSYNSKLSRLLNEGPTPPAISTLPLNNKVAVRCRAPYSWREVKPQGEAVARRVVQLTLLIAIVGGWNPALLRSVPCHYSTAWQ